MTEKNYNPEQKNQKSMRNQENFPKAAERLEKKDAHAQGHTHVHADGTVHEGAHEHEIKQEAKLEGKKAGEAEAKKTIKERPKKTKAFINVKDLPISAKHAAAICMFIKRKKINDAIKELEQVSALRKPIPMKGEIPHRKGEIMSGRYPKKAAKNFIVLLKSLSSNCSYLGIEDPMITEAFANKGGRTFGRRGVRKKRTQVVIAAENKTAEKGKVKEESKNKEEKKEKKE